MVSTYTRRGNENASIIVGMKKWNRNETDGCKRMLEGIHDLAISIQKSLIFRIFLIVKIYTRKKKKKKNH